MLECWSYSGLVARMILPLGLNVRSAELSLKSVMLPPPNDALEREERRAAVWMAFYHDTVGRNGLMLEDVLTGSWVVPPQDGAIQCRSTSWSVEQQRQNL